MQIHDLRLLVQTQIIRVEEEKEKVEAEMLRQARDLEMLQNTIQKSQRERENMQSEMEVLRSLQPEPWPEQIQKSVTSTLVKHILNI